MVQDWYWDRYPVPVGAGAGPVPWTHVLRSQCDAVVGWLPLSAQRFRIAAVRGVTRIASRPNRRRSP